MKADPVKICKTVNFACGCLTVYHYKGDLTTGGWEVIPCREHAQGTGRCYIAEQAQKAWEEAIVRVSVTGERQAPVDSSPPGVYNRNPRL